MARVQGDSGVVRVYGRFGMNPVFVAGAVWTVAATKRQHAVAGAVADPRRVVAANSADQKQGAKYKHFDSHAILPFPEG